MVITLADFDIRWGVQARESEEKIQNKGRGGAGFKKFRSHKKIK